MNPCVGDPLSLQLSASPALFYRYNIYTETLFGRFLFPINKVPYLYMKSTTVYMPPRRGFWDSSNPFPASEYALPPDQRVGGTLACE